jgi:DNA-binding NarL/FixJ family response regulator
VREGGCLLSSSSPQTPYDPAPQTLSHRSRVLIVDDNCFVRQALTEIFRRESDFDVCGEAANGHEAVRAAQPLGPDLIVLDLAMPVMNGLDAARVLRRLVPEASLIMYCGFGDKFVEQQASLIGIAALISKAEPPGTLVSKARTVLSQRVRVRQ